ncbi:hypothetical protein ACQ5SK_45085 [Bradyrhizobium japonicum]
MTHDQVEALALSDRIVVMNGGRISQIGSPKKSTRGRQTVSSPTSSERPIS